MSDITIEEAEKQIASKQSTYHTMFKRFVEAKQDGELHPDIYSMNYKEQFWLISFFVADQIMLLTAKREGLDLNSNHEHRISCLATLAPVITADESWGIELLMESDANPPLRPAA